MIEEKCPKGCGSKLALLRIRKGDKIYTQKYCTFCFYEGEETEHVEEKEAEE